MAWPKQTFSTGWWLQPVLKVHPIYTTLEKNSVSLCSSLCFLPPLRRPSPIVAAPAPRRRPRPSPPLVAAPVDVAAPAVPVPIVPVVLVADPRPSPSRRPGRPAPSSPPHPVAPSSPPRPVAPSSPPRHRLAGELLPRPPCPHTHTHCYRNVGNFSVFSYRNIRNVINFSVF